MLAQQLKLDIRDFTDEEIKDITEALELMLGKNNREGYIRILNNQGYYSENFNIHKDYKVKDLLNATKLKEILNNGKLEPIDLFYSVNTYRTKNNAAENNILQIINVMLDIDYKKSIHKRLSNMQFIEMLERDIFGQVVPTPSAVIFTGNNVHLIYNLKYSVNATVKAKALAKRVQKHLTEELKEFNADRSINLTTLTRVIHSRNSKNMGEVSIKTYNNTYELRELQEWLPPIPNWYKAWKKKKKSKKANDKGKVIKLHTEQSLLIARIKDLEKLQELRGYRCYGYREIMCYLYRNFVIQAECDPTIAKERMLEFNSEFVKPLKENRIESKTRIIERHTYKYRNDTLITLLDISEEEQKQLNTIISKEEKGRRNNERTKEVNKDKRRTEKGLTKREQEKANRIKAIKELQAKKLTQKEIAKEMKISERMVRKYIKQIKEDM